MFFSSVGEEPLCQWPQLDLELELEMLSMRGSSISLGPRVMLPAFSLASVCFMVLDAGEEAASPRILPAAGATSGT